MTCSCFLFLSAIPFLPGERPAETCSKTSRINFQQKNGNPLSIQADSPVFCLFKFSNGLLRVRTVLRGSAVKRMGLPRCKDSQDHPQDTINYA